MSPAALDIVLLEPHEAALRLLLQRENGAEASAYVLFGKADISADPWSGVPRTRLISHEVIPVAADEMVSASPVHVTWSTRGFMRILGIAKERGLVAGTRIRTRQRSSPTRMTETSRSWPGRHSTRAFPA